MATPITATGTTARDTADDEARCTIDDRAKPALEPFWAGAVTQLDLPVVEERLALAVVRGARRRIRHSLSNARRWASRPVSIQAVEPFRSWL